jgi:hypothetical protein
MKNQKTTIEIMVLLNFAALPAAGDFSGKMSVSCERCLLKKKIILGVTKYYYCITLAQI